MERPKLEVADVFRGYGVAYREKHGASMSIAQRRVISAIEVCRTAALGGHLERRDECGHERNCFNSCRDRHCPKCQSLARAQWIQDRQSELLDVPYFHVVFTVPEEIAAIAFQNKRVIYSILFRSTAETLTTIAADPELPGVRGELLRLSIVYIPLETRTPWKASSKTSNTRFACSAKAPPSRSRPSPPWPSASA